MTEVIVFKINIYFVSNNYIIITVKYCTNSSSLTLQHQHLILGTDFYLKLRAIATSILTLMSFTCFDVTLRNLTTSSGDNHLMKVCMVSGVCAVLQVGCIVARVASTPYYKWNNTSTHSRYIVQF